MATSVTDIFRRVRHLIQDGAAIRWRDEELLLWLNDAQRELLLFKPDANAVAATFTCAAGTRQTLPAGGIQLLDIPRNTSGRVVRRVQRAVLDAERPDWHSETGATVVRWFCYDARTPTVFYVSPPSNGTASVELLYGAIPDTLSMDDDIGLADIYVGPLVDYVCYRAYAKDSDFAQSAERAKMFYNSFYTAMTGKQLAELESVQPPGESTDAVR